MTSDYSVDPLSSRWLCQYHWRGWAVCVASGTRGSHYAVWTGLHRHCSSAEAQTFTGDLHEKWTLTVNSLWPSDAILWHRSGSTLAQVMACCLTAASHYLNQCWLIISKVHWHSSEGNFAKDTSVTNHWNQLENYFSQISFKSPRGQWVKSSERQYIVLRLPYTYWGYPTAFSQKFIKSSDFVCF